MSHFLTGIELLSAIQTPPLPAEPLIADFLYTDSVCLLTGAAGKGKTVLAVQLAASLSSATPCFGSLDIARPHSVYYLQLEGSRNETLMRLHYLHASIPINASYFYFDFDKQFRVTHAEMVQRKLAIMRERLATNPLDLLILDPIYKLAGDLAKAENALAVITFSDLIAELFHCSILLIHHPHRERYDVKGKVIQESNPYYGHSFLYNHVDSSFLMTNPEKDRVLLTRDKVREENTRRQLSLLYHPESYSLSMVPELPKHTKKAGVERFLEECKARNITTSFAEIQERCLVSGQFLRELQTGYLKSGKVEFRKVPGKSTIWIPK